MQESVEHTAQDATPSDFSAKVSVLLQRFHEEMEQAENWIQEVNADFDSVATTDESQLNLYKLEFEKLGKQLIDLIQKSLQSNDPNEFTEVLELVHDLESRIEFLYEESNGVKEYLEDGLNRFTNWVAKLSQWLNESSQGTMQEDVLLSQLELAIQQAMDEGFVKADKSNFDKNRSIERLEDLASLLLESDVITDYEDFIDRVTEKATSFAKIDNSQEELAQHLALLDQNEHERLASQKEEIKKAIKELIWNIDTESAIDLCKKGINEVEQQVLNFHGQSVKCIGEDLRQAVNHLESISYIVDPVQEPHSNLRQSTNPEAMNEYTSTPDSTSASFDELQIKLMEIERKLNEKADRREFAEQSASSITDSSTLNTELSRIKRRLSELEDLSAMPGELNESLVMKQIGSLSSEISVLEKQTKLLLTDLNQKVESAVLKGELNSRLRELPTRDHLREIENMLRDRQSELSHDLKGLRDELANRPSLDQLRKISRDIYQDERKAEQFVERFELKGLESSLDQLSERISKKVDMESISDRLEDFVNKSELNDQLKLLEMHKNETRLFLSDMQEKLSTIPDYQSLVDQFVNKSEFDEQIKKRGKALGEIRLDVDVALEKANNALSLEELEKALESLKASLAETSAFTDLKQLVQELTTKVAETPTSDELDQLGKVVKAHSEHISRLPEESAVDAMIRVKVEDLEARVANKDETEDLRSRFSTIESDMMGMKNHHDDLQDVLKVIQSDIQDLDINKDSFIQNFNEELKESLFKMISEYDASLQHDLEDKLKQWKSYQDSLKQEQLDAVLKFLNEEVYEKTNEFKDRLERNVSEHIQQHAIAFDTAKKEVVQLNEEHKSLMDEVRRSRRDLSELEDLKKESLREFRDELRRAKSEIFDTSESGMRQYYDEQLDKLRRSYEEKNEQILDLLAENRGDWFSQNLMGIIAVILAGVAVVLGINGII